MKHSVVLIMLGASLVACNNDTTTNKNQENNDSVTITTPPLTENDAIIHDRHTAHNVTNYEGTYTGTLPCASCEGIATTLVLNKDKTFTLKEKYKGGKESGAFNSKGSYIVNDNVAILKCTSDDTKRIIKYQIEKNKLFMLDADGKKVEGSLAESYVLTKK